MKILFLTQFFHPEPIFKGLPFARALAERGHHVQVLTGFPNYPGGKLYDGYRLAPFRRDLEDGIEILRVPLFPSHDTSSFRRICTYGSFATAASMLGPWLAQRPDLIYVYHPPATVGAAAIALARWWSVPFVFDVQDLWPESLSATAMRVPTWTTTLVDRLCRVVYREAAAVVAVSEGVREVLRSRGVPPDRLFVIRNWCDESALRRPVADVPEPGVFRVLFAGNLGAAQGLDTVLEAAALLQETSPSVRITFVGAGVESERLRHRAAKLANVAFLDHRPPEAMPEVFARADALLVHLRDDPLFAITIPSKTQAYLAMGKPIVMAVRGEAARMVEDARAGVLCPPEDPVALATSIERLRTLDSGERARMGRCGAAYYERELAMRTGVDKFEQVFTQALTTCERRPHG